MADAGSTPEAHYADVYRFVQRRSASDQDAQDVTQTVFLEAAARLEPLCSREGSVLGWLYVVARRRLIDQARRRAHATHTQLLEHEAPPVEYGLDVRDALARALRSLPDSQRAVVVARLLEGASFAEIAERLHITEAAVQMRLSRGLTALREALATEGYTP